MDISAILISQYQASLDMLEQTIVKCPESAWDTPGDRNRFWQVAYHALYFVHEYLADSYDTFVAWEKHREVYDFDDSQDFEPYDKETILEYLAFLRAEVEARVSSLDLEAGSGFYWLPFDKLELQFYNIRHLQHHTGELGERLGAHGIEVDWVGRGG